MPQILKNKNVLFIAFGIVVLVILGGIFIYLVTRPSVPPSRVDLKEEVGRFYKNSFVGGNFFALSIEGVGQQIGEGLFIFPVEPIGTRNVQLGKRYDTATLESAKTLGNQLASKEGFEGLQGNFLLAAVSFEQGNYKAYLEYSRKAFDLAEKLRAQGILPGDSHLILMATAVAHAAMYNNEHELAVEWIIKAMSYPANVTQIHAALMRVQYGVVLKKYKEARAFYEKLLNQDIFKLEDSRILVLLSAGSLCIIEEDLLCASQRAKELKEINAHRPDVLVFVGSVAAMRGDYEQAKEALDAALMINPNLALGHYIRGLIAEATGHSKEAKDFYEKSLNVTSRDISLYPKDKQALQEGIAKALPRVVSNPPAFVNRIAEITRNILAINTALAELEPGAYTTYRSGDTITLCQSPCNLSLDNLNFVTNAIGGLGFPSGTWGLWSFAGESGWFYTGPTDIGPINIPGFDWGFDFDFSFDGFDPGDVNLRVGLTADPSSGTDSVDSQLTADISGTAAGDIDYHFWWDCQSLSDVVSETESSCGSLPDVADVASGTCAGNPNGYRCMEVPGDSQTTPFHTYTSNAIAKVIAKRGEFQAAAFAGINLTGALTCLPKDQTKDIDQKAALWATGGASPPVAMDGGNVLYPNGSIYNYSVWGDPLFPLFYGKTAVDINELGWVLYSDGMIYYDGWIPWTLPLPEGTPGTPVAIGYSRPRDLTLFSNGNVYFWNWELLSAPSPPEGTAVDINELGWVLYSDGRVYYNYTNWNFLFPSPSPEGTAVAISGNLVLYSDASVYNCQTGGLLTDPFPHEGTAVDISGTAVLFSDAKVYNYTNWNLLSGENPPELIFYSWLASDGDPDSGSGLIFQTQYGSYGENTVTLTDGADTDTCDVLVSSGFDFSLSLEPSSGTVIQGGSVTSTVHLVLNEGDTKLVNLAVPISYLIIAEVTFDPASCFPPCDSTMTIAARPSTLPTPPDEPYPIPVIGRSEDGEVEDKAWFNLTVTTPCDTFFPNDYFHGCIYDNNPADGSYHETTYIGDLNTGAVEPGVGTATPFSQVWGNCPTCSPPGENDGENFSLHWRGNISFAEGKYTFYTNSDDGSWLYVDTDGDSVTELMVNNGGLHGATRVESPLINISAGYHQIEVEYFEQGADASLEFGWELPVNQPPIADATVSSSPGGSPQTSITVTSGQTIYFFSSKDSDDADDEASYDPDGTINQYEWDWEDEDGGAFNPDWSLASSGDTDHSYLADGDYVARLRVTDNDGLQTTALVEIYIITPPLTVDCSADPASASIDQEVTWTANVFGGTSPYNFSWSGEGVDDPDSPLVSGCAIGPPSEVHNCKYTQSGSYKARFDVTDNKGDTAFCLATVNIRSPSPIWREIPPY